MNKIFWKPKATKQIGKIKNSAMQKKIYTGAQVLSGFPNCQGVKKLTNHEYSYRLRIGNYRLFFEFDGGIHVIEIEEVKKRDENTY